MKDYLKTLLAIISVLCVFMLSIIIIVYGTLLLFPRMTDIFYHIINIILFIIIAPALAKIINIIWNYIDKL